MDNLGPISLGLFRQIGTISVCSLIRKRVLIAGSGMSFLRSLRELAEKRCLAAARGSLLPGKGGTEEQEEEPARKSGKAGVCLTTAQVPISAGG